MCLAVRGVVQRCVKVILRLAHSIDILVEEPVHFVVSIGIHGARHMLFHDGLEVLGGRSFIVERLAISCDPGQRFVRPTTAFAACTARTRPWNRSNPDKRRHRIAMIESSFPSRSAQGPYACAQADPSCEASPFPVATGSQPLSNSRGIGHREFPKSPRNPPRAIDHDSFSIRPADPTIDGSSR